MVTLEAPDPLVASDCDCTDLDGFMLNVERLMSSELVALSSHEVVAASLFLWCRAWKQRPAASLPDNDRVNAAFAMMPIQRYKKLKEEILRGFVKCSDGRLYHRVLAQEARQAFAKKEAFRKRRNTDAERLRKWRASNVETAPLTQDETRFVAEGQGQGQGQGQREERSSEPNGSGGTPPLGIGDFDPCRAVFEQGLRYLMAHSVADHQARALLGKWRKAVGDPVLIVVLADANKQAVSDPVPWIEAAVRKRANAQNPPRGSSRPMPTEADLLA